jgi:hypothetical protein
MAPDRMSAFLRAANSVVTSKILIDSNTVLDVVLARTALLLSSSPRLMTICFSTFRLSSLPDLHRDLG